MVMPEIINTEEICENRSQDAVLEDSMQKTLEIPKENRLSDERMGQTFVAPPGCARAVMEGGKR